MDPLTLAAAAAIALKMTAGGVVAAPDLRGREVDGAYILVADSGSASADSWAAEIAEASRRFGIPEPWIRAVIRAESGGIARAVSPKGAMGLMQLMPETWAELRARYGLGSDPFDPRDNILAGVAYLRELYDRYGYPDLFAAYNAGPARLDEHLAGGRPLPEETRAYLAALGQPSFGPVESPAVASGTSLFFAARGTVVRVSGGLFVPLSTASAK